MSTTSKVLELRPDQRKHKIEGWFLLLSAFLSGCISWSCYYFGTAGSGSGWACIGFGLLSLAAVIASGQHFICGHKLCVRIEGDLLTVIDYSSEKHLRLADIIEVTETVDNDAVVIITKKEKVVIHDNFFSSQKERDNFVDLLARDHPKMN